MEKRIGIKVRDSEGTEIQAKENFKVLDELFLNHKSRSLIAQIIGVSCSAISNYASNGNVSLYSTTALSNLFKVDRDFFNGKKVLIKDSTLYKHIENQVEQLKVNGIIEAASEQNMIQNNNNPDDAFVALSSLMKSCSSSVEFYDNFSISELEELLVLLDNNLKIVKSKLEILNIVHPSNQ